MLLYDGDFFGERVLENGLLVFVIKLGGDGPAFERIVCIIFDLRADLQSCIFVLFVEVGGDEEIGDADLGGCVEIDVAVDSTDAPCVLVFEVAAVGPAVNFGGEDVFSVA